MKTKMQAYMFHKWGILILLNSILKYVWKLKETCALTNDV